MGGVLRGSAAAALALVVSVAWPLGAQMDMQHPMEGPLGIPETRMGSGTSWLPDASPMHAAHHMLGRWTLMLHGQGFFQYDWHGGSRGSNQLGIVNWAMAAASRPLGGGQLQLRGMLSTEPWTIGARGYPLLVQSGESYQGAPLHDRQHPHDLFMELAALYERPVARDLGLSLYLAPVGEPAVGPVAFPHRPSAADDPLAPIAHHWQDGTHITFGVLTAGVFTRNVKLEASWFNGREPDENRTDFDYAGRRLDSYSGRLTVNPSAHWSLSAWYAYLKSPEGLHPDESLHRVGAAALTTRPLGHGGTWSNALIYGANDPIGSGRLRGSVVLESTLDLDGTNSFFGRAEYVRKSAEELVIASAPPSTEYDVGALALGYLRTVGTVAGLNVGAGVRGSVNFLPPSLNGIYGSRTPTGLAIYVSLRPSASPGSGIEMGGKPHMHGVSRLE
ncbi:MAG TPA: hypothetical protein VJX92_23065 [Methylomirabilota bacterium]|nr:hypothetical protein [Methylomirabilota bacterium]